MTFALLLVCFFLSGFSALLYETAWTREFAFVFGTSELAVVAVAEVAPPAIVVVVPRERANQLDRHPPPLIVQKCSWLL